MSTDSRQIHEKAAVGFERAADAYERGRPDYPREAIDFVHELLIQQRLWAQGEEPFQKMDSHEASSALPRTLRVADIAAGTGKFTKVLFETGSSVTGSLGHALISEIVAVEPVAAMRAKCAARFHPVASSSRVMAADSPVAVPSPSVQVIPGVVEHLPFVDDSLDVVTVAQAFHWFDSDRAIAEIHRVLKPGGMLILVWNVRDESVAWIREMTALMEPYEGDAPRYRSMKWRDAFDRTPLLTPLELTTFHHMTTGSIEMMIDRVASVSFVASLGEGDRETLLTKMRELYLRVMNENRTSSNFEMPYETRVYHARKL